MSQPDELALLDWPALERLAALIPCAATGTGSGSGADNSRSAIAFRKGIEFCKRHSDCTYEDMAAALRADPETEAWCREKGNAYGGRELRRIWAKATDHRTKLILDPSDPLGSARLYHVQESPTLLNHHDIFYEWNGCCYPELELSELRARLYLFLESASKNGKKGTQPYKPTMVRVANVLDALRAVTHLLGSIDPPAWLDHTSWPPARDVIACRNGPLHLPTLTRFQNSPKFFTHNALDFDFDPQASSPANWLRFLHDLWPNDPATIETLQEIFGYCLTVHTHQQKIFAIIGPRRSGKGTIARVLRRLIGRDSTCAPTLAGIATNFGLAPLIGKQVGIISDARIGCRADQHAIVERLLSISGEDVISIDRKYLPAWTGRLRIRFLILSNELPQLTDASGALSGRFIMLALTHSFYGREDIGLIDRLLLELPGILNWSIAGWQRLNARGHFVQPQSAPHLVEQFKDLASPIAAFLRDCCDVGAAYTVETNQLFEAWCRWCSTQGREHPGNKQAFGRDLHASIPGLKVTQPRDGQDRQRFYQGIRLK
jgi:putative DNA primase/helicase